MMNQKKRFIRNSCFGLPFATKTTSGFVGCISDKILIKPLLTKIPYHIVEEGFEKNLIGYRTNEAGCGFCGKGESETGVKILFKPLLTKIPYHIVEEGFEKNLNS